MLRVFGKDETSFSSNGLCVLENAADIKIHKEINGEWELSFKLPAFDEKRRYIVVDNIVLAEGQGYRINNIDKDTVSAVPLYMDAAAFHLPTTGEDANIGKKPRCIMSRLFERVDRIHIMKQEELDALDMKWVDNDIDLFEQSPCTPIGALAALMEQLDKYHYHNELYFDNYNIALVKKRGRDTGYRVDLRLNTSEIQPTIDSSEVITRLYPYGKNGLEITNAANGNGKAYIDSARIKEGARVVEGFINFDEIDDPNELLEAGKRQFDEENPERVDIPKYSVNIKCFQQGGEIDVGDIVEVNDMQNGIVSKQRVISMEFYPFEPNRTEITVGTPTMTLRDIVERTDYMYVKNKLNTNERGELKTSWLEMMQRNESVSINKDLQNEEIALYKTGSLYEFDGKDCNGEDYKGAVAIIKGRLAIANQKENGQWKWTSIMDGGKVIVNEVFTGALYTSDLKILDAKEGSETLNISDSLIKIKDKNSQETRIEIGCVNDKYVFTIYQKDGKTKSLYLNDNGDAEFAGTINTRKDVMVGDTINIRHNADDEFGKIYAGKSLIHTNKITLQILGKNVDVYAREGTLWLRGQNGVSIGTQNNGAVYIHDVKITENAGRLYFNNKRVATKDEVDALQTQINALKGGGE